jgi:hypothetical protein
VQHIDVSHQENLPLDDALKHDVKAAADTQTASRENSQGRENEDQEAGEQADERKRSLSSAEPRRVQSVLERDGTGGWEPSPPADTQTFEAARAANDETAAAAEFVPQLAHGADMHESRDDDEEGADRERVDGHATERGEVRELGESMDPEQNELDSLSSVPLVSNVAELCELGRAEAALELVRTDLINISQPECTGIMLAFAEAGRSDCAQAALLHMQTLCVETGANLEVSTFNALMLAYARDAATATDDGLDQAFGVLELMLRAQIDPVCLRLIIHTHTHTHTHTHKHFLFC